jgi:hypothetical protein
MVAHANPFAEAMRSHIKDIRARGILTLSGIAAELNNSSERI